MSALKGDIGVERLRGDAELEHFAVRVDSHAYEVSVSAADRADLAPAAQSQALVRESFVFLLEREPPSAILPRFDLGVIQRYFPEYRSEIRRRLSR